jgi:hypothetical protein
MALHWPTLQMLLQADKAVVDSVICGMDLTFGDSADSDHPCIPVGHNSAFIVFMEVCGKYTPNHAVQGDGWYHSIDRERK